MTTIIAHFSCATGNKLSTLIFILTLEGGHYDYPHFRVEKSDLEQGTLPRVTQLESNGTEMQTEAFSNRAHVLKPLSNAFLSQDTGVCHSL